VASLRPYLYRFARAVLYRCLVPVVSRYPAVDKQAQRLTELLIQRSLFATNIPSPLRIGGVMLYHSNQRPSLTVRALALGSYEPSVVQAMRVHCFEGATVLDVGAHLGYYTLLAAKLIGNTGQVWAFEPDPDNRDLLMRNIHVNQMEDRVRVVGAALGSTTGAANLHRAKNDSGGSTVSVVAAALDDVQVEITTLDAWAASRNWPVVDIVKIDVEGAEPDVLRGMSRLALKNPRLAVIVECQKGSLERAGGSAMRLFDALRDLSLDEILILDDQRGVRPMTGGGDAAAILELSRWYPINLCCTRKDHGDHGA
jgi:FkbM family methyltransferase